MFVNSELTFILRRKRALAKLKKAQPVDACYTKLEKKYAECGELT